MNNPNEEWRPAVGIEDRYDISNLGRLRRRSTGRIRRPSLDGDGRYYHKIVIGGVCRHFATHVLVARTFIGPPPRGHEVDHKDGNRQHNDASNLEYVTRQENMRRAAALGLMASGANNASTKYDDETVAAIRSSYVPRTFGYRAVAEKFGIPITTAQGIINGTSRKFPDLVEDGGEYYLVEIR